MIRSSDPDVLMLGVGIDLGNVGGDMDLAGNGKVWEIFGTPFVDGNAALEAGGVNGVGINGLSNGNALIEPEFSLPNCYNVQPGNVSPQVSFYFFW